MINIQHTIPRHHCIRQYIKSYHTLNGELETPGEGSMSTLYPGGENFLVFIFDNDFMQVTSKNDSCTFSPKVYFQAHSTTPLQIGFHHPKINHFVIAFYPHAFFRLFGITATDFSGELFLTPEIAWIDELHERLAELENHSERQTLVENYFLYYIFKNDLQKDQLNTFIFQQNNFLKLKELAEVTNCSTRHLQKHIKTHTGMTYSSLRAIRQFQLAYQLMVCQINKRKSVNYAKIAQVSKYSDQSHMIHSFKLYTEHTPKQLISHTKKPLIMNIRHHSGILH